MNTTITNEAIRGFYEFLLSEEKSWATIDKYLRDVRAFAAFLNGREVRKEHVAAYKQGLMEQYAVRSVNSMLASINAYLRYANLIDCRVKNIRTQQEIFRPQEKELTDEEFHRILAVARSPRLRMILKTLYGTGARISELQFFTAEGLRRNQIFIHCKGKSRTLGLPDKLREELMSFAKAHGITSGYLFRTRNGNPVDRSNVWKQMKALARKAGVAESKVFPHNLRRLFARNYYQQDQNLPRLADVLGHSSINTTRIYLTTSGTEHMDAMNRVYAPIAEREKEA